jgi:hypothetical protein
MHDKLCREEEKMLRNQCRSSYDLRTSYFLLAHDFIMQWEERAGKVSGAGEQREKFSSQLTKLMLVLVFIVSSI